METSYKFSYFNARGRGEVARILFAYAGQNYEDCRIDWEDWPALKPKIPFGQLPSLEVNGVVLCQSRAINRFLAKRFGLAGDTDIQQAQVDMICDCTEDAFKAIPQIKGEKDEAVKAEKKKKYEGELAESLNKLEKLLCSNQGGDKYFVGDKITLADITVTNGLTWPDMIQVDAKLDKYPKLNGLKQRIEAVPKIAEWLAKRPESSF